MEQSWQAKPCRLVQLQISGSNQLWGLAQTSGRRQRSFSFPLLFGEVFRFVTSCGFWRVKRGFRKKLCSVQDMSGSDKDFPASQLMAGWELGSEISYLTLSWFFYSPHHPVQSNAWSPASLSASHTQGSNPGMLCSIPSPNQTSSGRRRSQDHDFFLWGNKTSPQPAPRMTRGSVLQHRMHNLINPDGTSSYSLPTSLFVWEEKKKGSVLCSKATLRDLMIVPLARVQTMQAGKNVQLSSVNSSGDSSEVPQTNQPMSSAAFN